MMGKGGRNASHIVGGLFTFGLVGMFVVLVLLLTVLGIDAYRSIIDKSAQNNDARASMSYLANKIRSGDDVDGIRIEQIAGLQMLIIDESPEGPGYETRIYFDGGILWECLFDSDDPDFDPSYGERIVELASFDIIWRADNLIGIEVTTLDGQSHALNMAIYGQR